MVNYDPHLWRDHMLDVRGSVVLKVAPRVLIVLIWSVIVGYLDRHLQSLAIPSTAHALIGVALGLLLVFRTNASYDRFWEGRRQWGAIVNASRNLSRGASALLQNSPELAQRLRDWTAAFAYGVMHRLRDGSNLGVAANWLPGELVKQAVESGNVPLAAATQMSRTLVEARRTGVITDVEQLLMDTQVAALVDAAGACDRIHKTPVPFAYVVHLRRALILYCGSLPFAMIEGYGWGEVAVTTLVAFVLLGIEEIGVEIEDPFGTDDNDLPLEEFCASIERDVRGSRNLASS
jgi:putative membrane protein